MTEPVGVCASKRGCPSTIVSPAEVANCSASFSVRPIKYGTNTCSPNGPTVELKVGVAFGAAFCGSGLEYALTTKNMRGIRPITAITANVPKIHASQSVLPAASIGAAAVDG